MNLLAFKAEEKKFFDKQWPVWDANGDGNLNFKEFCACSKAMAERSKANFPGDEDKLMWSKEQLKLAFDVESKLFDGPGVARADYDKFEAIFTACAKKDRKEKR